MPTETAKTPEELAQRLRDRLGLPQLVLLPGSDNDRKIVLLTPAGEVVLSLLAYPTDDGRWSFAGCSAVEPKLWGALCRL